MQQRQEGEGGSGESSWWEWGILDKLGCQPPPVIGGYTAGCVPAYSQMPLACWQCRQGGISKGARFLDHPLEDPEPVARIAQGSKG